MKPGVTDLGNKPPPTSMPLSTPSKGKKPATKAPLPPSNLNIIPKEVQEVVEYIESVGMAIVHRTPVDPPPTGMLSSTGKSTVQLDGTLSGSSVDDLDRSTVAVPLSLMGLADRDPASTLSGTGTLSGTISSPRSNGGLSVMVLLRQLEQHANKLLKWFGKVESHSPSPTEMSEAERCIQVHSGELIAAICSLVKMLKNWSEKAVQDYMRLPSTNHIFDECKKQIAQLHTTASTLAAVRRVVRERDLARAKTIASEYHYAVLPQPPSSSMGKGPRALATPSSSPRRGQTPRLDAVSPSLQHDPRPPAPPLVSWLAKSWIPAMEHWHAILEKTKEARKTEDVGLMHDALSYARSEAITRSSSLHEILLPGESLTELVERHVEKPMLARIEETEKKKEALGNLKEALKNADFSNLGSCIRAAEGVSEVLSEEERTLLQDAQKTLIHMQKVAKVTVALTIAQKSTDAVQLVRAVTAGNQLILSMNLAPDPELCKRAIEIGSDLLVQPITNALNVLATIRPDELIIEHLPSQVWASELSDLYHNACRRMANLCEQSAARKSIAQQLPDIRQNLRHNRPPLVKSGDVRGSSDELGGSGLNRAAAQALLDRCLAAGLSGPELDELQTLLKSASEIQIKVHYDSQVRLVAVPEAKFRHSFSSVVSLIKKVCKLAASDVIRLRYQDGDGDFITIETQEDWELLLRNQTLERAEGSSNVDQNAGTFSFSPGVAAAKVELYCDHPPAQPVGSRGRDPSPVSRRSAPRQPTPDNKKRLVIRTPQTNRENAQKFGESPPSLDIRAMPLPSREPTPPSDPHVDNGRPQIGQWQPTPQEELEINTVVSDMTTATQLKRRESVAKQIAALRKNQEETKPLLDWQPPTDDIELHTVMTHDTTDSEARQREEVQRQLANLKRNQQKSAAQQATPTQGLGAGKSAKIGAQQAQSAATDGKPIPVRKPMTKRAPMAPLSGGSGKNSSGSQQQATPDFGVVGHRAT